MRCGLPTPRAWAYMLTAPGTFIVAPWADPWRRHRRGVDFILRSVRAAFRLRHDAHVGKFARLALKAQVAALDVFDPSAPPDYGAAAFALAFQNFRGEWNALVAANAQDQPRRAAREKRKRGDLTRDAVSEAWAADAKVGRPLRGRIKRVAMETGHAESTVRGAASELGLHKARKRIRG